MGVPIHKVHWKHCWRIIPTRYPPENLLERVADPKDVRAVEELEGLTSTRARLERGEVDFLPREERATGPGSQYIMASFAYSLFNKSRFSDGSYGVYYGASSIATAVAETVYHRERFLAATAEPPMMLPMRVIDVNLRGPLHDVRGWRNKNPHIYSPSSYTQSQAFARDLWEHGSSGIVYNSVRHSAGECVAVFKPLLLSHCRQERQLIYEWDGRKISKVYELQEFLSVK